MTESLSISELDGEGRVLVLAGWTLPLRGVGFAGKQRTAIQWYAGNPVATLQVLGIEVLPTQMEGEWRSHRVAGEVVQSGWGDLETPADLVKVFEELRDRGSRIRVQWGAQIRMGIVEEFEAAYGYDSDVNWSVSFLWYGRDDREQIRAVEETTPRAEPILAAVNNLEEAAAESIPNPTRVYASSVKRQILSVRRNVTTYVNAVQGIRNAGGLPLGPANDIISAATKIADDVRGLLDLLSLPIVDVTLSERASDRFQADLRRRDVARAAFVVRSEALSTARRIARSLSPAGRKVVSVREGETLRRIAFREYGSADLWTRIASANGLVRSVVAPGTRLVIPSPAEPSRGGC